MSLPPEISGIEFITDASLVDTVAYEEARTWKERLFSRPWKPFIKNKTMFKKVPSKSYNVVMGGTIICHPSMLGELERKIIDKHNKENGHGRDTGKSN